MNNSSKIRVFTLGAITILSTILLINYNENSLVKLTDQPADEKQEQLAAWMHERLMDPTTGEVPKGIKEKELLFAKTLPTSDIASRGEELTYSLRGPYNTGGRTRAISYDATNLQMMLAGGVNGGVWKTENNGASWKMVSSKSQMQNVTAIVQDTRSGHEKTWYYGTGEGNYGSSGHHGSAYLQGNGVYKSTDNGETWSLLVRTAPNEPKFGTDWGFIWNMAIDASNTNQDEIYVAANGAIMRSEDGGQSWVKELGGGTQVGFAWVGVTSSGVVYAAIGNSQFASNVGIWRSVDGKNWTNIGSGKVPGSMQRVVFDIAPSNNDILYFLMRSPGSGSPSTPSQPTTEYSSLYQYEYISGDGSNSGGRWNNRSTNIPRHNNLYYSFNSQGNYNLTVKVKPNNYNIVFIGSTNLFRSTDGFRTNNNTTQIGGYNPEAFSDPSEYRYPQHHPDNHSMVFRGANSNEMISTTDGGIHFTRNCTANKVVWEWKNNGYTTAQFYTVAIDHKTENSVVLGGTQDNGTQYTNSKDNSVNWSDPVKSDGSYCAVQQGNNQQGGGIYYMSSQNGATYKVKMNDDGTRNAYQRMEYPGNDDNYSFINPFILDYNDNNTMYLSFYDQLKNKNIIKRHGSLGSIPLSNSRNPSPVGWVDLPAALSGRITAMKTTRSNPKHRLYVGCNNGTIYRIDNANGTSQSTELPRITQYRAGTYVSDIAVHPTDGDKILVCFSNYNKYSIYYSEDAGSTWNGVAGNLEDTLATGIPDIALGQGNGPSVRSVAFAKTHDGITYFAATSTGLYATYKLDGHKTVWVEQAGNVIGNTVVEKLDIRDSDNYMAIATHGRGIFSTYVTNSTPGNSINDDLNKFNNSFKAYPNPANGKTSVSIKVEETDYYQLMVYNQMGQIVKSLELGELVIGTNQLPISLDNLSRGTYFLNLKSSSVDRTIKLMVE